MGLSIARLYGSGLRLVEALRLRVQDMDFERMELTTRNGKVGNDRHTLIPESQCEGLKENLQAVRLALRLNPPAG